jgi:heme/copper-type cytochrome/quinol oxidase subunit 3
MSEERPGIRIVGDVSALPDAAFGPRSVLWWGNTTFMMIEGTAFVLAAVAYLYIRGKGGSWPPTGDRPPDLIWGGLFTIGLLLSEFSNRWLQRRAHRLDLPGVRYGMLLMTVIGLALAGVRAIELSHINVRWGLDAYASCVWLLMVLHTTHVVTDLGDTAVLCLWMFTHEPDPNQFSDVNDNCAYWTFVVVSWIPIGFLIYLGPRLL